MLLYISGLKEKKNDLIQRAKVYMDKLANGINPVDGSLTDMYLQSIPVTEIAATLKRTTSAINSRLKKLGLS